MHRAAVVIVVAFSLLASIGPACAEVDVLVNKSTQQMTVAIDRTVRYVWRISTGRDAYSTPNGIYVPERLERNWFSRRYYGSPMPYSIFFHNGYAIHGSYAISQLGGPASHGCVRLDPQHAAILYDLVLQEGIENTRIVVAGGRPNDLEPEPYRGTEREPYRGAELAPYRDGLPYRGVEPAPYRDVERAPYRGAESLAYRDLERAPYRGAESPPSRDLERAPYRGAESLPYRDLERTPYHGAEPVPYRRVEPTPYRDVEAAPSRHSEPGPYRNMDDLIQSIEEQCATKTGARNPRCVPYRATRELADGRPVPDHPATPSADPPGDPPDQPAGYRLLPKSYWSGAAWRWR
jgi:hypothetical protein